MTEMMTNRELMLTLGRAAREAAEELLDADPQAARRHVARWLGARQEFLRA